MTTVLNRLFREKEGREGVGGKYENQQTGKEHMEKGKRTRQSRRSNLRLYGGEEERCSSLQSESTKEDRCYLEGEKKQKNPQQTHNKLLSGFFSPKHFFFQSL